MKKILFSLATLVTSLAFGQITLEHSFPSNRGVKVFNDGAKIYYFVSDYNTAEYRNKISIYNSDYTLYKTITFPWDTSYNSGIGFLGDYGISKYVFNTDEKFEFIVTVVNNTTQQKKNFILNEDGDIIKDLADYYVANEYVNIYHDSLNNVNKMKLVKRDGTNAGITEIYLLPTTELTTKEIQGKNKLSAFPIPTNKILNIINPENGSNKIEIYDLSGKLILIKNFSYNENRISLNVENLLKGTYIYKIGDLNSKFIKN